MADTKVSALTALAAADAAAGDLLYVADVSAGASGSKKMVLSEALSAIMRTAGSTRLNSANVITLGADAGSIAVELQAGGMGLTAARRVLWGPAVTYGNTGDVFNVGDLALARAGDSVLGITRGATSGGGTLSSLPLSPAQITANQNDYAPGVARYYRLTTDASRTLTGLSCSQVDGQECEVWNVGSFDIVLAHQSGSSTAANRFICPGAADTAVLSGEKVLLRYDGTTARWRVTPQTAVVDRASSGTVNFKWGTTTNLFLTQYYNSSAVRFDVPLLSIGANFGIGRVADGVGSLSSLSGGIDSGSATLRSVPLSPSQITANQNNYSPGVAHTYRLTADAARDITGLSISQVDGQWGRIFNVGSNAITLKHQDAASTAANRFLNVTGADIVLAADEGAQFEYDSTTARFRVWKL